MKNMKSEKHLKQNTKKHVRSISIAIETGQLYLKSKMPVYTGNATLYIIFATFPLIMMAIAVINMLPGYSPEQLTKFLFGMLPDMGAFHDLVESSMVNLKNQSGGLLASIAAITTLWSASGGINAVQTGLKQITPNTADHVVRDRVIVILYTILFIILIPALLTFQMFNKQVSAIIGVILSNIGVYTDTTLIRHLLLTSTVATSAVAIFVILMTYTYLPGGKRTISRQIPGTIMTAVSWFVFTELFGFFIPRFYHSSKVYGSLASLFLALLWLRFIVGILFMGGALNTVLAERRKKEKMFFKISSGRKRAMISRYGASLVRFYEGYVDVVLGYDTIKEYQEHDEYIGALVGPSANRIGGATFELDGEIIQLEKNDKGRHNLHSGQAGYSKKVWDVVAYGKDYITLSTVSEDREGGFPGNMTTTVTYTIDDDELRISMSSSSDMDTICNLTSHAYFNLNGIGRETVENHLLQVNSDQVTATDADLITTGDLINVAGTVLDFREPRLLDPDHYAEDPLLKDEGGYDHNFVIRTEEAEVEEDREGTHEGAHEEAYEGAHEGARAETDRGIRKAASLYSPNTRLRLDVLTNLPGLQVYSGNYISKQIGKGNAPYGKYSGIALEAQYYPNAINHLDHEAFEKPILYAGETREDVIIYRLTRETEKRDLPSGPEREQ